MGECVWPFLHGLVLGSILVGSFVGVASALGWLLRRPPQTDSLNKTITLSYQGTVRAGGLLLALVLPGAALAIFVRNALREQPPLENYLLLGAFLVVHLSLGGYALVVGLWSRLILSPEGITRHSLAGQPIHLPWAEVVEISLSKVYDCYFIRGSRGQMIWVSPWLDGLPSFWEVVNYYCPPDEASRAA